MPATRRLIALACLSAALAGCVPLPFGTSQSPYAPGYADGDGVDGLIVGHRLMAAGEYDLALKAYYRAMAEHGATVDTLSAIGSANLKLGRLGQAEQILRRATEKDAKFVPAWNNLGVVLMEEGKVAEAARTFRIAYGLDNGESDAIRENLMRALAKIDKPVYDSPQEQTFKLVRRGHGEYLLLTKH
ncbi:tetratricopeptide repeat protein [Thioclava sp. GXIMD4216]|uniref:Tetratricopeptide repeat protein n=1 Tax=Thioclava litoralis TaxID=3076557 RepID=A0ABZ1E074_9RHOB|nr:tetratricopeptide repeat protein [Thioclava sp. FTW29]